MNPASIKKEGFKSLRRYLEFEVKSIKSSVPTKKGLDMVLDTFLHRSLDRVIDRYQRPVSGDILDILVQDDRIFTQKMTILSWITRGEEGLRYTGHKRVVI